MAKKIIPLGESGRVMPIMLSTTMQAAQQADPRGVIVHDMPWELFEEQSARAYCERNHGQTIEEIARRGGFDATEAVGVLVGLKWGELRLLKETHAHRILYHMVHLFRRGVLTGRRLASTEA